MENRLLVILNVMFVNSGKPLVKTLNPNARLREDLGFDSLELAELTVRIEEEFEVDVFSDGLVSTVGEIMEKIKQ